MLPKASIFDFDKTLADTDAYIAAALSELGDGPVDPQMWDPYIHASIEAPPIGWVLALARSEARAGNAVLVVTARSERWRAVTDEWLLNHPIPHTELVMRAVGDTRPDEAVKADLLVELRRRYDVGLAVEDSVPVLAMWNRHEVPTIPVLPRPV